MDDKQLIERFLGGDALVVEQVRTWIRASSATYRSSVGAYAEDLEQEILLDLTSSLRTGRFRGDSSFRTYVRSCCHHKCIDRLRAASRRQWVDLEDLKLYSKEPSAFERMSREEIRELASSVLAEMSESCRELWAMAQEGLRYGEMSVRLKVDEGALRARMFRCRKRAQMLRRRFMEARGKTAS